MCVDGAAPFSLPAPDEAVALAAAVLDGETECATVTGLGAEVELLVLVECPFRAKNHTPASRHTATRAI